MAFVHRHVDDGRVLRDLVAGLDEPGDQQIASVGVAEHDARSRRRRNDIDAVAQLLVGDLRGLPHLDARLGWNVDARAPLWHVGIIGRSPARRPIAAIVGAQTSAAPARRAVAHVEDRTVEAPQREIIAVAERDGARGVDHFRSHNTADDPHPLALSD